MMNSINNDIGKYFETHVFCCENSRDASDVRGCCKAKGASELRDYMKKACKELGIKKTRINTAGCLDRCELGPTMVIYPEGVWYHYTTKADIDEIIHTHIIGKKLVERLLLKPEQKRL
jgi:(2Fe-2S) ferredoxin